MKAYCACKRSFAQKREEPAAPVAEKAGEAANATAGGNATNGTNATAPAKEVDLESMTCNKLKPEGKDLKCKLEDTEVTVSGPAAKKDNATEGAEGEKKEGEKEGEAKKEEKPAEGKEGEKKEGEGDAKEGGQTLPLPIKVTAPNPPAEGNATEGEKKEGEAKKEDAKAASLMQKSSV